MDGSAGGTVWTDGAGAAALREPAPIGAATPLAVAGSRNRRRPASRGHGLAGVAARALPGASGTWLGEVRALRADSRERRVARVDAAARAGLSGVHFVGTGAGGATLCGAAHVELASRAAEQGLLYGVVPLGPRQISLGEPWADYFLVDAPDGSGHGLLRELARTGKPIWLRVDVARTDDGLSALDALVEAGCRRLCVVVGGRAPDGGLGAIDDLRRDTGLTVGWSDRVGDEERLVRAHREHGARHLVARLELEGEGREGTGLDPSALARVRAGLEPRRRD